MTVASSSPARDSTIREFRQALTDELQAARTGPSTEPFELTDGRRVARLGDRYHYRFHVEQTLPKALSEDASAELVIGTDRHPATIVRHEGLDVTLALETDLGARVERAALIWDMTFLLEQLRDRLGHRHGLDNRGGELLIGQVKTASRFDAAKLDHLNAGQRRAVSHALGSACTYIWGPPGTGKTQTIGHLVAELVRRGRSVLLVSHTNVAIDEAVLRTADVLGSELPDGEVLRLGSAYGPRIAERPRLLPATHIQERSAELGEALAGLKVARQGLEAQALAAQRAVELADWLARAPALVTTLGRLERAVDRAQREVQLVEDGIRARQATQTPGRLNVDHQRRAAQQGLLDALAAWRNQRDELFDVPARHRLLPEATSWDTAERLARARAAIDKALSSVDIAAAREQARVLQPRIATLDRQIQSRKREIERLADDLVESAQVVACTLTAAFLRKAVWARTYDTVVIDEASIAPIPAAWHAANLAERAVVAVGDFRQVPPIALAETPLAEKWLKRDVFEVSGVRHAYEAGEEPSQLLPLTEQHRMSPEISRLPNKLSYRNLLQDAPGTSDEQELADWFDGSSGATAPVCVVELASLGTWATSVRRGSRASRLNLLSAAVSIDVLDAMLLDHRPPGGGHRRRALVITPYRPQAELLGAMIRGRGLEGDATAGTIHAFQGSEASVVVLDLTVAEPHYRAAVFAPEFDEQLRRMLNVAVTRARRRLVVVADRPFILQHAARGTALRDLTRMLTGSRDVRAADHLRLEQEAAIVEAVEGAGREIVWFADDVERQPSLLESITRAARRGVPVCVVTAAGQQSQLGIRIAGVTRLREAGAAIFDKWPLRESLLIVDRRIVAVRPRASDGWSVWSDAAVTAHAVRAHDVRLLMELAASDAGACRRCGGIVELAEGDHTRPGLYARCSGCRAPSRPGRPHPPTST